MPVLRMQDRHQNNYTQLIALHVQILHHLSPQLYLDDYTVLLYYERAH